MKKMLLFLRFVLWEYASRLARFRLCAVSSRPSSAFRPAAGGTEGGRGPGGSSTEFGSVQGGRLGLCIRDKKGRG